MDLGCTGVATITVICFLVAMILKTTRLNNKWLPIICAVLGGVLGILSLKIMPSFPANDYITAAAVGIASGLAATGAHQIKKQLKDKSQQTEASVS